MKKLTYIHLVSAILAVIFINITTQVLLPILGVVRPGPVRGVLSEYIGRKDRIQKLEAAIDIYIKHQTINQQIPQEEKNLVEEMMRLCRQRRTIFEVLGQRNSCTPLNLKRVLILILEYLDTIPVIG